MLRVVLALLLVASVGGAAGGAPPLPEVTTPHIVAVVPNPLAEGDRGEYLVVAFPRAIELSNWSVADGESTARFPDRAAGGRVAVSTHPDATRELTDLPVLRLSGFLALANGGETIRLRVGNRTVDTVRYGRAPEGEEYARTAGGWRWQPLGATDFPVVSVRDARVRAFVLPDSPSVAVDFLAGARERVLLAGYTLAGERVVGALCEVRSRGVRVRVLLDGEPVGGMTRRGARALDRLTACGVGVTVLGGEAARYAFHHAKYAVVDDRALVTTENWKPSGVGGRSSRGWGAVVDDPAVATALAAIFRADAEGHDGIPWPEFREGRSFAAGDPRPTARYPSRFAPTRTRARRVDVIVAPDNAEGALIDLLEGADESIHVEQVSIGSPTNPLVRALVRAARRGVRVRVLLSGAWYVEAENRALAGRLNRIARTEGLPLSVRLADPRSRFGKIHAKGVVVDRERVALGSINWNNVSLRENREVVLLIHDGAVGRYYARVFRADWRGGVWRLPVGLGTLAAVAAIVSGWIGARTVRFGAVAPARRSILK